MNLYLEPGKNPLHILILVRYECWGMSMRQPLPPPTCFVGRHKQTCGVSAELTATEVPGLESRLLARGHGSKIDHMARLVKG